MIESTGHAEHHESDEYFSQELRDAMSKIEDPRRKLFAMEYVVDYSQSAAARRSGWSDDNPSYRGRCALNDPNVARVIDLIQSERKRAIFADFDEARAHLSAAIRFDLAEVMDSEGGIDLDKLKNYEYRKAVVRYRQTIKQDGSIETALDLADGRQAIVEMGEMLGWHQPKQSKIDVTTEVIMPEGLAL